MKANKIALICLLTFISAILPFQVQAKKVQKKARTVQKTPKTVKTTAKKDSEEKKEQAEKGDTIVTETVGKLDHAVKVGNSTPKKFKGTQSNELTRESRIYAYFDTLTAMKRPARIVHIGDSHVRGHSFTVESRKILEKAWGSQAMEPQKIDYRTTAIAKETGKPGMVYSAIGRNGAICANFTSDAYMTKIKNLKPDLIILSFGTNECHVKHYNADQHKKELEKMLTMLKDSCPNAVIILTTPAGAFFRYKDTYTRKVRNKRGKRITKKYNKITFRKNPGTAPCVNTINTVAKEHNITVWDLYNIGGGVENSANNWASNNYMKSDHVHYTHQGYHIQGDMLAEALLKAYNNYLKKKGNAKRN